MSRTKDPLSAMAKWLSALSTKICHDNQCRGGNHHCESYAYACVKFVGDTDEIKSVDVMDVCAPDYFSGSSRCNLALPLPFHGGAKRLRDDILRYVEME